MLKKVFYPTLLLLMGAITYIFAMQQQEELTLLKTASGLIKIQAIAEGLDLEIPQDGAGIIKDG